MSRLAGRVDKLAESAKNRPQKSVQTDDWAEKPTQERIYSLLRAIESLYRRSLPLHLCQCPHHIQSLLRNALSDFDHDSFLLTCARIFSHLRLLNNDQLASWHDFFAFLESLSQRDDFTPVDRQTLDRLMIMYRLGISEERRQQAHAATLYPYGKPLDVCPICLHWMCPDDSDARIIAALSPEKYGTLILLGQGFAFDKNAPDWRECYQYITGESPIPDKHWDTFSDSYQDAANTVANIMAKYERNYITKYKRKQDDKS